jgi:hypothetical protein
MTKHHLTVYTYDETSPQTSSWQQHKPKAGCNTNLKLAATQTSSWLQHKPQAGCNTNNSRNTAMKQNREMHYISHRTPIKQHTHTSCYLYPIMASQFVPKAYNPHC